MRLKAGLQPVYATIMKSGVVLIVWQGGERVIAGAMTVGAFIAYLELFLRFVNRGHRIPQLVNSLRERCRRLRSAPPPPCLRAFGRGKPPFASFRAGHMAVSPAGSGDREARTGPASLSLRDVTFRIPAPQRPYPRSRASTFRRGPLSR